MPAKPASPSTAPFEGFPVIDPHTAAVDISSTDHWAAAADGSVQQFGAMTDDLHELVAWLQSQGARRVALEATGVYWRTLATLLFRAGLEVVLVNPLQTRRTDGRKTDHLDCQWAQQLLACGMVTPSVIPDADRTHLQVLVRQRDQIIDLKARAIVVMQNALSSMNLKLQNVLRDIAGKTGLAIIDAILNGQRDPAMLARLRDPRCKSDEATIVRAMTGTWDPAHLMELRLARERFLLLESQITTIDGAIDGVLQSIADDFPPCDPPKPTRSTGKNRPRCQVQQHAARMMHGVDLTQIDGVSESVLLRILAEIGWSIEPWPTMKRFCSWLKVAPTPAMSGGKRLRKKHPTAASRARAALLAAARGVINSKSHLGHLYRRITARSGPGVALGAVAHRIARIIYAMLRDRAAYEPARFNDSEEHRRTNAIRATLKKLTRLGLDEDIILNIERQAMVS